MPRLTGEARRERDELVYALFLDGVPYRTIGQRVDLSVAGVHKAVYRMMLASPQTTPARR